MAKKKKQEPIVECYYAKYYVETGVVAGILNHKPEGDVIEISKDVAMQFLQGTELYTKYKVVKGALVKEKDVVAKSTVAMFESISEAAGNQEVIIEWNQKNRQWIFTGPANNEPIMFVVKESNHDVLLRVLRPSLGDVPTVIPFATDDENDIKNVAVLTRKSLDSYGLRIVYE
jgi:hypothetical protein